MARGGYGRRAAPSPAATDLLAPGRMSQILGSSGVWTRVAGLSGGLAVVLGAYGAHGEWRPLLQCFPRLRYLPISYSIKCED
jgi:hypothetical protein